MSKAASAEVVSAVLILGVGPAAAVERTSATAGRTITFSALTVATSLSGLFLFDSPMYRAIAATGVSVVLIALDAGLTLVPGVQRDQYDADAGRRDGAVHRAVEQEQPGQRGRDRQRGEGDRASGRG